MALEKLDALIKNLNNIERSIINVVQQVIKDNEHIILEMNTEDQLYQRGIDSKGRSLGEYSPITISIKREKGQPTNRVTLRDSQDFHRSFYIEYSADSFEIKASDPKTDGLLDIYGDDIIGLTADNFRDISENYVKPELIKLYKR